MKLTEKLDLLIKEKGITLADVARESGVPYTTIKSLYDKDMKDIEKDFVERKVIEYLKEKVFSPNAIDELVARIARYVESKSKEITKDVKVLADQLTGVQTEINNIVNAIAAGMFHTSMKEKMDELEAKKASLTIKLEEAKLQAQMVLPTNYMIRQFLQINTDIDNKELEEQKRIIQAYIKSVIVYDDRIDINTVVDLNGGGEAYHFKSTIDIKGYRHNTYQTNQWMSET